jgi:hypothetical protein
METDSDMRAKVRHESVEPPAIIPITDTWDPTRVLSIMLHADPTLPTARNDKEEPKLEKSSREHPFFNIEPLEPNTETPEDRRLKCLKLTLDPIAKKSKQERALPNKPKPYKDSVLPIRTNDRTESDEPNSLSPNMERTEPYRTMP